ncbi:MAG: malate synthase A [Gammaproteobacteria bacterium]|nr:malate synthase A [Gammaproteobacteria bacterium]
MHANTPQQAAHRLQVVGPTPAPYLEILTPEALAFVADLVGRFAPRCRELLDARRVRQRALDAGQMPDFLPETREIRESDWTVAAIPADLRDRRVEITGPVERKMIINALNSGARTFMADFEDSSSPTWAAMVEGQINLRDAICGTIEFVSADGKRYCLGDELATLLVRPRGWHLKEKHIHYDGEPIPAALFDFGLYFFHNVSALRARGTAPYFYLPKMESHLEARLWNEVFNHAQDALGVARGTVRATVLIETILAAFEMDEILWELREHSSGLNCGRWDYIFSFIKCFRNHPEFVLPDRAEVTMTTHFLRSYSRLLIRTCHRRGIHAMGGMAAQIPIKNDPEANERALDKVRQDKLREVRDGHDGTWVAHPGLVPLATSIFDEYMPGPNQIDVEREDVQVVAADLLRVPEGRITIAGLENNVSAALRYTESWIMGQGCVPLFNLMEDAATAEISRAQIWQWIRYPAGVLDDGRRVTVELFRELVEAEITELRRELGADAFASRKFREAAALLDKMVTTRELPAFLTLEAYGLLD